MLPDRAEILAIYHTHGSAPKDDPLKFDFYSDQDFSVYDTARNLPKYSNIRFANLGTPQGNILRYDLKNPNVAPVKVRTNDDQ